ncbi:MAG: alpha/beta fold hydrolase [Gammaproteobacteria bacterium]
MKYLAHDGTRIHYEVDGRGPPLLFSTGFVGTTRMWDGQVAALSANFTCIRYDFRGHGASAAPADPALYTEERMLDDMAGVLAQAGAASAALVGLSLGGYLSFKFALRHPGRVTQLALLATGPGFRTPESGLPWKNECLDRARLLRAEGMEGFMRSAYSHADTYTPPELMRTLDPIGVANVAEGVMANTLGADRVAEIAAPTLLIVGAQDAPFVRGCEYLHRHIRGSRLLVIPGAGHAVNIDAPAQVNAALAQFLGG